MPTKPGFISGFGYAIKGIRLVFNPGTRRYVAIPLLINFILFGGAIYWGYGEVDSLLNRVLPSWIEWLKWLLIPVFLVTAAIIVFYTFTVIANLFGAPFNGVLSEKIEHKLGINSKDTSTDLITLAKDIPKSVFSEFRKLSYLLLWSIPLLILFLIPGINILAPIAWSIFSMWMLALEYTDYPMENHGLNFSEKRRLLKQNKRLTLGFGAGILLITFIPGLNFLAMPAGVVGATVLWVEQLKGLRGSNLH